MTADELNLIAAANAAHVRCDARYAAVSEAALAAYSAARLAAESEYRRAKLAAAQTRKQRSAAINRCKQKALRDTTQISAAIAWLSASDTNC